MAAYKSFNAQRAKVTRIWAIAGALMLVAMLLLASRQQHRTNGRRTAGALPSKPLRLAIYNQVNIHLHVVAGAMHVLRPLTSAPITVYLPSQVLNGNKYGFMEWLGQLDGFNYRDCKQLDQQGFSEFDLMWFISPEWNSSNIASIAQQLNPRMALYYVHNGHMPDSDFNTIKQLSQGLPLLTMGPHVAQYVSNRLQEHKTSGAASEAEWVFPVFPYQPSEPCNSQEEQDVHSSCLSGFCISGSTDPTLRNYTRMWEQIRSYREQQGDAALANFKLNILGEIMDNFTAPDDLQQHVVLHKTPSDQVFYEVNYHCYGIVPALANPAYFKSKLTSAVITSLMTGVPVIADSAFLSAYSMLNLSTVFHQSAGQSELDAMFSVAAMPAAEIQRTRLAVQQLRHKMNARAVNLILGWMLDRGLVPDAASAVASIL